MCMYLQHQRKKSYYKLTKTRMKVEDEIPTDKINVRNGCALQEYTHISKAQSGGQVLTSSGNLTQFGQLNFPSLYDLIILLVPHSYQDYMPCHTSKNSWRNKWTTTTEAHHSYWPEWDRCDWTSVRACERLQRLAPMSLAPHPGFQYSYSGQTFKVIW